MSKKKYYVDIGSAFTTIQSNILLFKEPSCVIIQNGFNPKLIASGKEAAVRRHLIGDEQQFINPISEGAVMHYTGAVLMLKSFLKKAKVKKSDEIIVYFNCGLSLQQKRDLEAVFLEIGYRNITLCEKLLALKPYVASYGNMVVADIGDKHTDVGIINEGGIVSAYSIDIGGATITSRLIKTVERIYNLNITYRTAEKLKTGIGSLYANDVSRMAISGRDIITGVGKNVEVCAKDIYDDIVFCYKRIIKVIEGRWWRRLNA